MNQSNLSFTLSKPVPLIIQSEIAECGLASMEMVASYYGHKLDMAAMRKRYSAELKGMNLQQIIELGDSFGLASRALQCPIDEVHKLQTPCILYWDMNSLTKEACWKALSPDIRSNIIL
jgi:ATP-binding cassette, subfamily B, bacterial CvaB/MchF/RaxB